MTATAATTVTPDGAFTVLLDDGDVLASGWTEDVGSLVALVHPALRPAPGEVTWSGPAPRGDAARAALGAVAAFYDGDLEAPATIAVRQRSGEFRMRAWDVLRQVAPGERVTYSAYAARAGHPSAVRAAAAACAMNAAALFVPCHRVLRSDGGLGGFRYGLAVKQRLLDREAAASEQPVLFRS